MGYPFPKGSRDHCFHHTWSSTDATPQTGNSTWEWALAQPRVPSTGARLLQHHLEQVTPAFSTGVDRNFHVPRSCVRLSMAWNRIQEQTEPAVSQQSEPLGIKLHYKELYSNVTLLSTDFLRNDWKDFLTSPEFTISAIECLILTFFQCLLFCSHTLHQIPLFLLFYVH